MKLPLLEVIIIIIDISWANPGQSPAVTMYLTPQRLRRSTLLLYVPCSAACQVPLFATLWTVAHQAPLPMGVFRQEYWSGLPFPLPGVFLTQRLNPISCSSGIAGGFFPGWAIWVLLLTPILLIKTVGPERLDYFSDEEIHLKGCRDEALNPRCLT